VSLVGLRSRLRAAFDRRIRVRPTRVGVGYVALLLGVLVAAVNTGNNLLYLVLSAQLAVLVLSNLMAELNLRGLSVRRILPPEVYAGQTAVGAFELRNLRGRVSALTVHIEDLGPGDAPTRAHALVAVLQPGLEAAAPARWHLPSRGMARLDRVRLWSDFPFGLVRRYTDLSLPVDVLVYPVPVEGRGSRPVLSVGATREDRSRSGREGDFRGIRPYQAGDPLRDLHWPTTARTGHPMIVQRAATGAPEVIVRVEDCRGDRWERALSLAAGEVEQHLERGDAVGLAVEGQVLEARTGDVWRRRLLTRLALLPRRDQLPESESESESESNSESEGLGGGP